MYESFFGLRKRPFAALPDPACLIPVDPTQRALNALVQCAADGRGIGVLTGPAGAGKTLVCRRVAREMEGRFAIAFLPSGNILTRRALLQAILFELGHSFVRMGDQELRLALSAQLRHVRPSRRGVVLIVDEAHLLAPRLLEELRTFADCADGGEALVRLIVCGQPPLEEVLSQPSLAAFNQRVGSQTAMQPFTMAESIEYATRRLAWAGGNVSEIFARDALAAICEAGDGIPRCINQLADQSLLLGFQTSDRPVSARTVHLALAELKRLPLTWNEPYSVRERPSVSTIRNLETAGRSTIARHDAIDPALDPATPAEPASSAEMAAIEFGGSMEHESPAFRPADHAAETAARSAADPEVPARTSTSIVCESPVVEIPIEPSAVEAQTAEPAIIDEEIVIDRYAALDAALNRLTRTMICARVLTLRKQSPVPAAAQIAPQTADQDALPDDALESHSLDDHDSDRESFDVVLPEDDQADDEAEELTAERPMPPENRPHAQRRYERLFTELRRRRLRA